MEYTSGRDDRLLPIDDEALDGGALASVTALLESATRAEPLPISGTGLSHWVFLVAACSK